MDLDKLEILERIKVGDEKIIELIYQEYRLEFFRWSSYHFSMDDESSADIFQDSIICFCENVYDGKLSQLSSTVKTYLFGIAKNLILKKLNKDKKYADSTVEDHVHQLVDESLQEDAIVLNDRQKVLYDLLKELGEPCKTILRLFYYKGYSMEAIARELDYKNENVAKTQKMRCLQEIKKRVLNRYEKDDI